MGLAYTRMTDPTFAVPLIMVEATGFALLNPALYAVVAANSPIGRSSTAQGLFGAAGTVGFIVASLIAGALAQTNIVYPMYVFAAVLTVTLVLGLIIGGPRLNGDSHAQGLTESASGPRVTGRGVEQRQLVGLITRRSEVRILSPQPSRLHLEPRARPPGVLSLWRALAGPRSPRLSRPRRSCLTGYGVAHPEIVQVVPKAYDRDHDDRRPG